MEFVQIFKEVYIRNSIFFHQKIDFVSEIQEFQLLLLEIQEFPKKFLPQNSAVVPSPVVTDFKGILGRKFKTSEKYLYHTKTHLRRETTNPKQM